MCDKRRLEIKSEWADAVEADDPDALDDWPVDKLIEQAAEIERLRARCERLQNLADNEASLRAFAEAKRSEGSPIAKLTQQMKEALKLCERSTTDADGWGVCGPKMLIVLTEVLPTELLETDPNSLKVRLTDDAHLLLRWF